MTAIAERHLKWCEKNYRPKGAEKFSTKGRPWVKEFFTALFGWKLWPVNPEHLCGDCLPRIGEWHDWSPEILRSLRAHAQRKDGCLGLRLLPSMVTILQLHRGEGKTTNGFAAISAALDDDELAPLTVHFVASAGTQTETLVRENMTEPLRASKMLDRRFFLVGNRVEVRRRGRLPKSSFEFVETSFRSITGRRRDILFFDEARDVPARVFAAMLPSIRARSRFACPHAHAERPYSEDAVPPKCPTCRTQMLPRIPRVVIVSTAGLDEGEGGEYAWFNETVAKQLEEPSPYVHLYVSEKASNPNASKHESDMMQGVFGDVPALRDYLGVELGNRAARKGDDFVNEADLLRVSDPTVENLDGSLLQCVGFLDTSWSSELTTLLLAGWDPDLSGHPWQQLRLLHWKIWAPKRMKGGVIDPSQVQDHLDRYMPLFPSLVVLLGDDRGNQWAKDLVIYCNKERARLWGSKVKLFHGKKSRDSHGRLVKQGARLPGIFGGEEDRSRGWQLLEQRVAGGPATLAIPEKAKLPELHAELLGVMKKKMPDGSVVIVDRNRKQRHADVADALAGCSLLAYLVATNQTRGWFESEQVTRGVLADIGRPVVRIADPRTFF